MIVRIHQQCYQEDSKSTGDITHENQNTVTEVYRLTGRLIFNVGVPLGGPELCVSPQVAPAMHTYEIFPETDVIDPEYHTRM